MSLKLTHYDVRLRLLEDLLGTVPMKKDIYKSYIADKGAELMRKEAAKGVPLASGEPATPESIAAATAEEVDTVEELEERGWTSFHKITDEQGVERPVVYDYYVKGFLKETARTLKEYKPEGSEDAKSTVKQLQDKVQRYVFVKPRMIFLPPIHPEPLERPLRALTAQGPRVALARSDVIKAGGEFAFRLTVVPGGQITEGLLRDIFEYAQLQGFGQWRSGGWGRAELVSLCKVKD